MNLNNYVIINLNMNWNHKLNSSPHNRHSTGLADQSLVIINYLSFTEKKNEHIV